MTARHHAMKFLRRNSLLRFVILFTCGFLLLSTCPPWASIQMPSPSNTTSATINTAGAAINNFLSYQATDRDCSESTEDQPLSASLPLEKLWVGDVANGDGNEQPISLFLNFCQADIAWLNTYLIGHTMNSTTIISKCGNPLPFGKKMFKRIQQMTLPNVGRNDHSIAHIMSMISENPSAFENHIIVFLKDNLKLHQQAKPRSLSNMIRVAQVNGFGCFLKPRDGLSMYHDTATMVHFNVSKYREKVVTNDNTNFKSPYANMGAWLDQMDLKLPTPYTSVCYGGSFAVQASRIASIPSAKWKALEQSLSRDGNIEEGHFAERSWSGLLSIPPTDDLSELLGKKHSGINVALSKDGGGQLGALLL